MESNLLNEGGGRSGVWKVEGIGREKSLVGGGARMGFMLEMRSGSRLFDDDCCCSSSFLLLSDGDNLSFDRCCCCC